MSGWTESSQNRSKVRGSATSDDHLAGLQTEREFLSGIHLQDLKDSFGTEARPDPDLVDFTSTITEDGMGLRLRPALLLALRVRMNLGGTFPNSIHAVNKEFLKLVTFLNPHSEKAAFMEVLEDNSVALLTSFSIWAVVIFAMK